VKQFLWKQKIRSGFFFNPFLLSPLPPLPVNILGFLNCCRRRLSTDEENTVVQAARQTPLCSLTCGDLLIRQVLRRLSPGGRPAALLERWRRAGEIDGETFLLLLLLLLVGSC